MKYFASASEAGKSVNLTSSAICNVCQGRRTTAGGYHWEYVD